MTSTATPPIVASLSMALMSATTGEILWSQVGNLRGSLETPADLTSRRLEQLVDTALPEWPVS